MKTFHEGKTPRDVGLQSCGIHRVVKPAISLWPLTGCTERGDRWETSARPHPTTVGITMSY